MTTRTSRSASAAPTASSCPGLNAAKPNSSCSAPCGSRARATGSGGGGPRPGRARVEAASMGRRTLPPAPAGSGGMGPAFAKPPQSRGKAGQNRRNPWRPGARAGEPAARDGVDEYLAALTRRLREVLGDQLVGVYAGGSYAMGAYVDGRSDLDVAAVVAGGLPDALKHRLVDALRHEALPCPAIGLELVVYPRATVELPTALPGFELNLNTGARIGFRADFTP